MAAVARRAGRRLAGASAAALLMVVVTALPALACTPVAGGTDPPLLFTGVAVDNQGGGGWQFTVARGERGDPGPRVVVSGFQPPAAVVVSTCDRPAPVAGRLYRVHTSPGPSGQPDVSSAYGWIETAAPERVEGDAGAVALVAASAAGAAAGALATGAARRATRARDRRRG